MKAEEIEQIKNAAQGMSLNDVVDTINYLQASSRLVENQRDSFYDKWVEAESQLKEEREDPLRFVVWLIRGYIHVDGKFWKPRYQDNVKQGSEDITHIYKRYLVNKEFDNLTSNPK